MGISHGSANYDIVSYFSDEIKVQFGLLHPNITIADKPVVFDHFDMGKFCIFQKTIQFFGKNTKCYRNVLMIFPTSDS